MADLVKKRCRNVATHLQIGTPVSVAGDFFFADQPVIPRITGVVQEAINKAGKVKVKWDIIVDWCKIVPKKCSEIFSKRVTY